ncbi:HAMP domain-containing protein [Staphylococcus condimenti]|uniref:Sensor protein SrrB n=3 Tax=Staphylococcus TaxID=1279 RepID=A0AB37H6B6_9STAP|nr:ATP-binding protein [Staphylococcus condimenti]OFP01326.1 two-component sensor histidine kinase [Staphylococcus sp. HMSC065E08]AMY04737.1 two-component sensor histidine kinase [Staphylococcus condimenti]APR60979.1 two-component sensor histidine kinase [Staphylococcus condimenti]QQS83462.1 HAMP domain-containing protein [Staphylococcus condimenti]QRP96489.1 HAMP domain-containing protein [Staphylococcus condimenti]
MMQRLNSVVIKLWLTIILIVTTVLILLSAALITFIQNYYTQDTEQSLIKDAKRISMLLEESDNKSLAIKHSKALIEDPSGLIIMKNKNDEYYNSHSKLKNEMMNVITKNPKYQKVFTNNKKTSQHIKLKVDGKVRTYVLLGYPTKIDTNNPHGAVFIYQDLKSIDDTNNVITIIILVTAVIFLIITTVFAFFLSSRITKPLRQLRTQALNLSEGDYSQVNDINSKDEIGELAHSFNIMSSDIQRHIDEISASKNIRDSLINSMVEGVLGINEKREIILSNEMAKKMAEQLRTTKKEQFTDQMDRTFKEKEIQFQDYEVNNRFYVVIMSYIEQFQPNQSGVVAIIRDMTNEHQLDQMKKDFIANVSHELRTPIALLQGYTESIVDGVVSEPDEIRDSLSIVLDETQRLNRLVNELLNVARMDAEGLSVNKEVQPIDDLLERMQLKYRQQAEDLQIDIKLAPDTSGQLWYYDTDRMEQVLTNLVDNASRYTSPGDAITISASESDKYDILYVADTGSGIAPEHIDLVFDRFYKVDASRKRGKEGTGLGLFICRMIIEAQGGTIDLKSRLGEGTTFIIKLPKPPKNN